MKFISRYGICARFASVAVPHLLGKLEDGVQWSACGMPVYSVYEGQPHYGLCARCRQSKFYTELPS